MRLRTRDRPGLSADYGSAADAIREEQSPSPTKTTNRTSAGKHIKRERRTLAGSDMQDVPNLRRSSGGFDIRANARDMRVWAHDAFVLLAILKPVRLRLHAPKRPLSEQWRYTSNPTGDSRERPALPWRAMQDHAAGQHKGFPLLLLISLH